MKFVMSYSCGKDSTLALHKMLAAGHEALGLLVMVREPVKNNNEAKRSYFHGADEELLAAYSEALGIPLLACPTDGENYHLAFEEGLRRAKAYGAEACCFGDIDIEEHRQWNEARCESCGLIAELPLWQSGRAENVRELLGLGYRCVVKNIDRTKLPEELLGRCLDREMVTILQDFGVDVCGENGEYHTLVVDGPIFKRPLPVKLGKICDSEYNRAYIEIGLAK